MTTPLEKPLRREIQIEERPYTLTIDGQGLKLVEKGRRNGVELAWRDLANGDAALAGKVELLKGETEWRFVPETQWKRGAHKVRVPSLIEDLAGNNIGEAFDVDSSEGERKRVNRLIHLSFEIR